MAEKIGVNNPWMHGMYLEMQIFVLIDECLQMFCEQHLCQFTLVVRIWWIIVFAGEEIRFEKKKTEFVENMI